MEILLQNIVALLAITNPLGAIPAFLAITERMSAKKRLHAGMLAALTVGIILTVAALAGAPILQAFGISLPAFQAVGGLVILFMGLEMLHGAPTKVQHDEEAEASAEERVLVPLAMPLLAGPGAITTAITLAARASGWQEKFLLLAAVLVVAVTTVAVFSSADWVSAKVGRRGQRIFLRFMGLILAAVGAQILLSGLYGFKPRP